MRFLRTQSGAKGSKGSGDGYLSDISRAGGGLRLIRCSGLVGVKEDIEERLGGGESDK